MVRYEFLDEKSPNTNKYLAYGVSLDEVFENAALALFEIITKPEKIPPKIVRTIELRSDDTRALLYDWLEELLRLAKVNSFLVNKVKVRIAQQGQTYVLRARLQGDITSDRVFTTIKAIAHEDTYLEERGDKYAIQVSVKV